MRAKTKHPGVYQNTREDGTIRYEIRFTDSAGNDTWRTVPGDLDDAVHELWDVKRKMFKGGEVVVSKLTLQELADDYFDHHTSKLRDSTRKQYRDSFGWHVEPRFGHLPIRRVTTDKVAMMVAEMTRQEYSAYTIQNALKPLSRMMSLAKRQGWVDENPVRDLDRSERPSGFKSEMRILDREEIHAVFRKAEDGHRLLLRTAVYTGLRQGELFRLRWDDLVFDYTEDDEDGKHVPNHRIRVQASKTQAGIREVAIPSFLARDLASESLVSDSEAVFSTVGQNPKAWAAVRRRWLQKALDKAGITDRVRFHDLRHTYASIQFANKRNIVWISKQLGHADPGVTMRVYAHLFDEDSESKQAMLDMERMFA